VNLPFLKNKTWPRVAKPMDEKSYGYSEDDELKEACLQEIIEAYESKDSRRLQDALEALVDLILSKEHEESDAADAHEVS
jgi:hypothetical protein